MTVLDSSSSWLHPAVVTYFVSRSWQWVRTSWSTFFAHSFTMLLGMCVTSDTTQPPPTKERNSFLYHLCKIQDYWRISACQSCVPYRIINLFGQFVKAPANLHTRIWVVMLDCHSYSAWFVQRGFLSDVKSVIRLCLAPWIKDVMFLILPLVEVLE